VASPWTHAIAGAAIGTLYQDPFQRRRVIALTAMCAALPDLDLIGWPLGISPSALLGHRGLTHSIPVAILLGSAATALLPTLAKRQKLIAAGVLILATITHGVLDALTTYAPTGPAFWAPFSNARYRFAWQPLSGTGGLHTAFGEEILYVWLPALLLVLAVEWWRRRGSVGQ
jgi:inner membrane protein